MFTNILFATTAKRVSDNDFTNMKNFNAANATENGFSVVWSSVMPDWKRARRGIFDVCRLLRGDIKTGKTFAAVPETISKTVGNVDKNVIYFDGNDHKSTGVLEIELSNKQFAYMWRTTGAIGVQNLVVDKSIQTATAEQINAANTALLTQKTDEKTTDEKTDGKTDKKTAKTTTKTDTAAHGYKCKNTAANRSILTNAGIIYTDGGEFLTYTTDAKTAKTLKIKTVK